MSMQPERAKAVAQMAPSVIIPRRHVEIVDAAHFLYAFELRDRDGRVKWKEVIRNLVTRAGAGDMLDKYFAGAAYTAAWYLGLIGNSGWTAVAKTDTMAAHGGWTEATVYSAGTRPAITFSAANTGSDTVTKAASSAIAYAINGSDTIRGAFVAANSTKGGTTGILYSAGTFSTSRAVESGDTLNVSLTLQQTV